jgi:hypothetical protein
MRNWRIIITAAFAASFCLVLTAFLLLHDFQDDAPGVTKANCKLIKEGMTLGEVVAIFGENNGFYGVPTFDEQGNLCWENLCWTADDGSYAEIQFRHNQHNRQPDRVAIAIWVEPYDPPVYQKVGHWLGLW